jgi:hypothetical protein
MIAKVMEEIMVDYIWSICGALTAFHRAVHTDHQALTLHGVYMWKMART